MKQNRTRYVLAYDVSDDGRRNRLFRLLMGYGERVQKSVFEADLNRRELKEILTRVAKEIEASDSFRAYPTCATCCAGVQFLGRQTLAPDEDLYIV